MLNSRKMEDLSRWMSYQVSEAGYTVRLIIWTLLHRYRQGCERLRHDRLWRFVGEHEAVDGLMHGAIDIVSDQRWDLRLQACGVSCNERFELVHVLSMFLVSYPRPSPNHILEPSDIDSYLGDQHMWVLQTPPMLIHSPP
jgi:hypothetical protein